MKQLGLYVKCNKRNTFDELDLKEVTSNRLKEFYGDDIKQNVLERYNKELNSIIENNFAEYYMSIYLIAKKVKEDEQVMILRGEQSSSLIAYLLDISYIDPFLYNLPFKTFACIDGRRSPVFEIEFAGDYIDNIYKYAEKILKDKNMLCTKDEYNVDNSILKLNFIENKNIDILNKLEELTKVNHNSIYINDINNVDGIRDFENEKFKQIMDRVKAKNIDDLIKIKSLASGTGIWEDNIENVIDEHSLNEVLCTRDEIYLYLFEMGIQKEIAFEISEFIGKGRMKKDKLKWNEYVTMMENVLIPHWYIESFEKIRYLFPKSHCTSYVMFKLWFLWYKLNFSNEFDAIMK